MPDVLENMRDFFYRHLVASLSGRLLFFTSLFVLSAQMIIYVPSAARHYLDLLSYRISSAQVAVTALDERGESGLYDTLRTELLVKAGIRRIAVVRNDQREIYLGEVILPDPDASIDLRVLNWVELIWRSIDCLTSRGPRVLRVITYPGMTGGDAIEILLQEDTIREDMLNYSERLLYLSLLIAFITSALVFWVLYILFVRPMKRVNQSMLAFQESPEDARRILKATTRADEIGQMERTLETMQTELRQALRQREHLAQLGAAVARIQHDLRNILSTAQLTSDRLSTSDDPTVKALTPRLVQSIDRAISLASNTLRYGKADEAPPEPAMHALLPLAEEAMEAALAAGASSVRWTNRIPTGLQVYADADQLLRILVNIGRNAVQALDDRANALVTLTAWQQGPQTVAIEIADNGPGIPDGVRHHLFEPFSSKGRIGGSGLGLAIARELARAHGGDVALVKSDANGTMFRIDMPARPPADLADT
jgi:signal transduction histidine kinase